jgi:hypothetical protein
LCINITSNEIFRSGEEKKTVLRTDGSDDDLFYLQWKKSKGAHHLETSARVLFILDNQIVRDYRIVGVMNKKAKSHHYMVFMFGNVLLRVDKAIDTCASCHRNVTFFMFHNLVKREFELKNITNLHFTASTFSLLTIN